MKLTSSMLLNVILLTILSASFFLVNTTANTTTSLCPPCSEGEYCAWMDFDEDGDIDLYDAIMLVKIYGSKGTPLNKTELCDHEARIEKLETRTDQMIIDMLSLLTQLIALEAKVEELEIKLDILNATKLGKPDYDTFEEYGGWAQLPTGEDKMFTHNLDTTNVLVYMVGYHPNTSPYIHQIEYGGNDGLGRFGVYWHDLTTTSIYVHRNTNDGTWQYVRVMIWKIPES